MFLSVFAAVFLQSCQLAAERNDSFCDAPQTVDSTLSQSICDMTKRLIAASDVKPIGLKVYELTKYAFFASFVYTAEDVGRDLSSKSSGVHIYDAKLSPRMYQAVIENLIENATNTTQK